MHVLHSYGHVPRARVARPFATVYLPVKRKEWAPNAERYMKGQAVTGAIAEVWRQEAEVTSP